MNAFFTGPERRTSGSVGRRLLARVGVLAVALAAPAAVRAEDDLGKAVIYQVSLRSFSPDCTFRAAEARLGHVKAAGADIVYLTPVFKMDDDPDPKGWSERQRASGFNTPKNPYRIADYNAIDPDYGTADDARRFVRAAHALGLKVWFDLVYLHCGPQNRIPTKKSTSIWNFPNVDFDSPVAREALHANMKWLVEDIGVDGFRCDVGDQVPIDFWEEANRRCRKLKPGFTMLNEGKSPEWYRRAFRMGYHFDFGRMLTHALRGEWMNRIAANMEALKAYEAELPADALPMTGLENHDTAADMKDRRPDNVLPVDAGSAMLVLCYLRRGVPMLWNGNEIADGRPITFFCSPGHPDHAKWTIDWSQEKTPKAQKRLALVRELSRLRHEEEAFFAGDMTWLTASASNCVFALTRLAPSGKGALVVVNPTPEAVDFTLPAIPSEKLLESGLVRGAGGAWHAEPYSWFVSRWAPPRPDPVVAMPGADAEPAVRIAAEAFCRYWQKMTGRTLAAGAKGNVRFAVDPSLDAVRDEYCVMSADGGLVFAGANARAVEYAVYDFLKRRCGCAWFWDGDVVPARETVDLDGVDIREKSRFDYRGIRYFAHRGLTRFQAEHWGFEDWKREIDWCVKNRLNLMMLRIGQDDVWQKAFPDLVPYPDPSKPCEWGLSGYDNRAPFWSLQHRGQLRKQVMAYAFERGLMQPEDFGTMTHWYSRTPKAFLEKAKPPLIRQQSRHYSEESGLVFDVRDDRWRDAYWKLTEASIANYGRSDLLHTGGLGERMICTNRAENLAFKIEILKRMTDKAAEAYPDAKILLAGWDFYLTWKPDEVKALMKTLDPSRFVVFDYEADTTDALYYAGFPVEDWGLVGTFPYTFGIFLAYEQALDVRANYQVIVERQNRIAGDPMCKGYILWPEASHIDTMLIEYFTANAWAADRTDVEGLADDFCRARYGDQAQSMREAWRIAMPVGALLGWWGNYGMDVHYFAPDLNAVGGTGAKLGRWLKALKGAEAVYDFLGGVEWTRDPFVRRDAIDLARTVADRALIASRVKMMGEYARWRRGETATGEFLRLLDGWERLSRAMVDLLALHADYSQWESYERLVAEHEVPNPDFPEVLRENADNDYCRSHQYEAAAHYYLPLAAAIGGEIRRRVVADDRIELPREWMGEAERRCHADFRRAKLKDQRPCAPRTQQEFRRVMKALREATEQAL